MSGSVDAPLPAPASSQGNQANRAFVEKLDRNFYVAMSIVIATVVVYGFSQTIDASLFHPDSPRPSILYIHGAIFSAWIVLVMIQSALVRIRNVKLHRKLGMCGLAIGIAIPVVGIATGIVMGRFNAQLGVADAAQFLVVPIFDMLAFSIVFALAFAWRGGPEFHRRLMLVATCGLTIAAFNRFPSMPLNWGYAAVDTLILVAVARDLIVIGRIHAVHLYVLPTIVLGQLATMYIYLSAAPWWVAIANRLIA